MKEFLIVGTTRQIRRIDAADICYIRGAGNSSIVYLIHGEYYKIPKQIGQVNEVIQNCLPYYKKYFKFIGRSFIVNSKNLSYIDTTDMKLEFFSKRTDDYLKGYSDGYAAGNRDGLKNLSSLMPPDLMVLEKDSKTQLPKEDLIELLNSIKENITVTNNEKNER